MNNEFYHLCYDQYKIELEEAENLYPRTSIILIVIPILATITVKLGNIALIPQALMKVDIFLYYLSFLLAWGLITFSVLFAILCVCPRKYKTIAKLEGWHDWKTKYEKYLKQVNKNESIDGVLINDICPQLAEAQTLNSIINEKRRKYFKYSVFLASISAIPIGTLAFLFLFLKIQGVIK